MLMQRLCAARRRFCEAPARGQGGGEAVRLFGKRRVTTNAVLVFVSRAGIHFSELTEKAGSHRRSV